MLKRHQTATAMLILTTISVQAAWAQNPPPVPSAYARDKGALAPTQGNPGGPLNFSPNPSNNTTGDMTTTNVPEPTSAPPRIGLFPETGADLLSRGIDFHGLVFDHFIANPSAGVDRGHTGNSAGISPAVDLDLGRLIGLTGGNLHIRTTTYALKSDIPQQINQTGGFITGDQTTPTTATTLLSVLTYEQRMMNDRLSVEIGRTNVANYFFLPNSLDPYTFRSTTLEVGGDFNTIPNPVWGGRATYKLTPAWYLQAGAFEDSFARVANNGNNFGVSHATGAQLLAELGYRTEFSNADYPANLELTLDWNTRQGQGNVKDLPVPYSPRTGAAPYKGGGVLYAQGQQVIWRGAANPNGPPPNVALYSSLGVSVDKPQPFDMDAMGGVNLTGLLPGRPFDALGLQARYQRLSAIEANFETRTANLRAGPGPDQSRNAWQFEAVANIQLTPAIAIRPFGIYFIDPDAYNRAGVVGRAHSGWEAGIYTIVALGRLFGTSQKPF